jgi:hypothetical protein
MCRPLYDIHGTSMTETSPSSAIPTKARAEAKLSASRVARAAIGDLMNCSSAAALSPLAVGCLVILAKHACAREPLDELGSAMQTKDAQTVLAMKGLSFGDSDLVLSALQMSGLVRIEDGAVSIPMLDGAIHAESVSLANRVAGWNKRGSPAKPRPTAQLISMPLPQNATPVVAPVAAPAPGPAPVTVVVDATVAVATARPAAVKRAPSGAMVRRFTSKDGLETDPAEDPVVVRIDCDGDRVAEITRDYQAYLEGTFKRIDVLEQLQLAALWCRSNPRRRKLFTGVRRFLNTWLSNASANADVRQAVVRAGNQKNGFGQGGSYESDVAARESGATDTLDVHDEFADLLEANSASTDATPLQAQSDAVALQLERSQSSQATFDDLLAAPVAHEVKTSQPAQAAASAQPTERSNLSRAVQAARAGLVQSRGQRPHAPGSRPTYLSQR